MKREPVQIHSPFIKLDAFLKFCGVAGTGGHAKVLIEEGQVRVDGDVCLQRGRKLFPGAVVAVEDREFEVLPLAD